MKKTFIIPVLILLLIVITGCQEQKVPNKSKIKKEIIRLVEDFQNCIRNSPGVTDCENFLATETEEIQGMDVVKSELPEVKTYISDFRGISWEVPEFGSIAASGNTVYYLKGLVIMNDLTCMYLGYWLTFQNDTLKIYGISIDENLKDSGSGFRDLKPL